MKQSVIVFLSAILLMSCAHYSDGSSVWSGWLWIIPALIAIGFVIFAIKAWRAYNSGTVEGGGSGKGPTRNVPGRPPMKNNGAMWFAIILFIAFWVVVFAINHAR